MQRRDFLLGSVPVAALAAPARPAPDASAPRVCLVAGARRPDIAGIFEELGLPCDTVPVSTSAPVDPRRYSLLWITCPDYPYHLELSAPLLSTVEAFLEAGNGVFAEFTVNLPGVEMQPRPLKTGPARLFVVDPAPGLTEPLRAGTILDEHDSMSLPLATGAGALRTLLSFAVVKGVQHVLAPPKPESTWPGLLWAERGAGRFALATTSFSDFRLREYAPQTHWERMLRELALALLPADRRASVLDAWIPLRAYTEPRRWVPGHSSYKLVVESKPGAQVRIAGARAVPEVSPGRYEVELKSATAPAALALAGAVEAGKARRSFRVNSEVTDRKEVYRKSLERNIRWYERSGALLRPDGARGVAEWISGPDINGNRIPFGKSQVFSPLRADCVFESGLAFWLAGKVARQPRQQTVGENLLLSILDCQRLGYDESSYGLWDTRGHSGPPWEDDTAWCIMGCYAGYLYTRKPVLLHRGNLSAAAALTAFRKGGREGLTLAGAQDEPYPHPHDRGQLLASWLYAYGVTGERSYLEFALPRVEDMIARFPAIPKFLISRTAEVTRFLLPLTLAYVYTRSQTFAAELRRQTEYLVSRMAPCGAIQESGSNAGNKLSGTDLGLTFDANEAVTDQLYTTSFAAMNLWLAYKATGDQVHLDAFHRVTDYLTRIQVVDPARPSIDGGWMRGFDYSLWEYYASNADGSWTAYCLETGWTNAIIDIALALYLLDETFYPARPA